jgi:hypothetical protein
MWLSKYNYTCGEIGLDALSFFAKDANNNIRSDSVFMLVLDTLKPIVLCKVDTVYLDSSGNMTLNEVNFDNGSNDNCSPLDSTWINIRSVNCSDTGNVAVTFFASDASGNIDSCETSVLVLDSIKPTITCIGDTTLTVDSGLCFSVLTLAPPVILDNCGILSLTNNINGFATLNDTFNVDTTNVIWTVADSSGNTNTCTFNVTVIDTTNPVIICPSDTSIGYCTDTLFY